MNPLPLSAKHLALLLLLSLALRLQAADQMVSLRPASKLTIQGSSNLHTWKVATQEIDVADFTGIFSTDKTLKPGRAQRNIRGSIPINSLHSSTDDWADTLIYNQLKGRTNPRILFHFSELIPNASLDAHNGAYIFDSRCELVVAGVTNEICVSLTLIAVGPNKAKITGPPRCT